LHNLDLKVNFIIILYEIKMAAKIGKLKLFGYTLTFVLRHRFEKKKEVKLPEMDDNGHFSEELTDEQVDSLWDSMYEWREWELGFWYKRYQVVGSRNFNKLEWDENLVYEHMLGINLLWCKAWVTVQKGAMVLGDK